VVLQPEFPARLDTNHVNDVVDKGHGCTRL
jgi:hypothetical protein